MNLDVVQIIMDCWHKIIDGWEKMDTNIINAMIQSLATILAVAVGFFFSIFSDKRQWKRAKVEQIREYQLSSLLNLTYHIQKIVIIIDNVISKHNSIYNEEKNLENSENLKEVRISNNMSCIVNMLSPINEMKCEINKKILELRLLKYSQSNIDIAYKCLEEIDDIIGTKFDNLFNEEIDVNIINNLNANLDKLIEEAEGGLRQ